MRRSAVVFLAPLLLAGLLPAQGFGDKPPVEIAPVGNVQVKAGSSKTVSLDFRIGSAGGGSKTFPYYVRAVRGGS